MIFASKQHRCFDGKCCFEDGATASSASEFEGKNSLGVGSYFDGDMGYGSYIAYSSCLEKTKIGRYTCIGCDVKIIDGNHPTRDWVSVHPAFFSNDPCHTFTYVDDICFKEHNFTDSTGKYLVEIGNDVWIGAHVRILSGVHIGDGAIIAAGAMVIEDVPSYAVVGGVPAKLIRWRFTEEQIQYLLAFKWWNKGEDWLKENAYLFKNIDEFISKNECSK